VIVVDGEQISRPKDGGQGGESPEDVVRVARLEVKLCKALAALDPQHELSVLLHGRITEALRRLRRHDATDLAVRRVADLSDDELRQAAGIVRAIRALPSWTETGYPGGTGFRVVLSGYALDLADEIDKRGRDKS
jgi:hypothetical protein